VTREGLKDFGPLHDVRLRQKEPVSMKFGWIDQIRAFVHKSFNEQ